MPSSARGRSTLSEEDSAHARDRVLHELAGIADRDALDCWAHRCLPVKNTLTSKDAIAVEQAFRAKLEALTPEGELGNDPADPDSAQHVPGQREASSTTPGPTALPAIEVPPPLTVSGTVSSRQTAAAARTSSVDRGNTTTSGTTR